MQAEVEQSMRETDLTVSAEDGLPLAGTLALPAGKGPHPAVVLLWAGRLDREGSTRQASLGLGRAMAAALARRGIASYRFDRRGVGATPGEWRAAGFFQHRDDAAAALRVIAARADVSAAGAVGYSEGALHAAWLGAHAGAAAVVLLGCPAQRGDQFYLNWADRLGKDQVPWWLRLVMRPLGRTPREQVARVNAKLMATTGDVARVYGFKVPARMCREYLAYDPKPDLAAIGAPVLAITGDNDLSVDHRDLDVIARLVPDGRAEIRRVAHLTHVLRRDPRPASARSYREQYQRPVDAQLLEEVAGWLAEKLPPARPAAENE